MWQQLQNLRVGLVFAALRAVLPRRIPYAFANRQPLPIPSVENTRFQALLPSKSTLIRPKFATASDVPQCGISYCQCGLYDGAIDPQEHPFLGGFAHRFALTPVNVFGLVYARLVALDG